jgi:aspartate aminotransferase-like enzyme
MSGPHAEIDPEGLLEYSVVFTDRSLNHMSQRFQKVMRDISDSLRRAYSASAVVLVPGGGTFAMEAVCRQFAQDKRCLVIRNGWFSYRWTQILDTGDIASKKTVLKARPRNGGGQQPFAPAPIDDVVATIKAERTEVVFCPHVETSSGIMLPKDYISAAAEAVHAAGGMFVLDCVASGAIWIDMQKLGVDCLITAPQKGWSGTPCSGAVLLSELARERIQTSRSTSFSCDLGAWLQIMEAYEGGGFGYHATLPTDSLRIFRDAICETENFGLEKARTAQVELGRRVRTLLGAHGLPSVAAEGFTSPAVIVSYTADPELKSGKKFAEAGLQVAAGVPLMCDEGEEFQTFRIGLFGLDKLQNIERTVTALDKALCRIIQ